MTERQMDEVLAGVPDAIARFREGKEEPDEPVACLTDKGRALIKGRLIKFVVDTCDLGAQAPKHMVEAMPEVARLLLKEF